MNDFDKKTGSGGAEGTEPTVDFDIVDGDGDKPGEGSPFMVNIPGRGLILSEVSREKVVIKICGMTKECVAAVLSGKSVIEVMNFGQLNSDGHKRMFRAELDIVGGGQQWSAKDFVPFGSGDHPTDVVRRIVAKVNDAIGSKPMGSAFDIAIEIKV